MHAKTAKIFYFNKHMIFPPVAGEKFRDALVMTSFRDRQSVEILTVV
jgi:hypothetical protein